MVKWLRGWAIQLIQQVSSVKPVLWANNIAVHYPQGGTERAAEPFEVFYSEVFYSDVC